MGYFSNEVYEFYSLLTLVYSDPKTASQKQEGELWGSPSILLKEKNTQ